MTSSPRRKVSSIIPLPSSHVRRTPSECDLAEDQKRAEYTDTRMYAVSIKTYDILPSLFIFSDTHDPQLLIPYCPPTLCKLQRLMCGIQSQIQRDCETNGGMVSPQNKSLQSLHGIVKTKSAKDDELDKLHCHDEDEKLSLNPPAPSKPYTGVSSSEKKEAGEDIEDEQQEEGDEGVFSLEL